MFAILKCVKCDRVIELNSDKRHDDKVRCISGKKIGTGLNDVKCACDIALFHIPGVMTWENSDLQSLKEAGIFEDVTPELGNVLFNEEKPNEDK